MTLIVASWIYWLVACACVAAFFARPQPAAAGELPPVSILKPLRGLDAGAYENLATFMRQDYPVYEVLLGVSDPRDPALDLVRRLQREFPGRRLRACVAPPRGANDKVSTLCHLVERARYDMLVICDSDMRVGEDYLRRIVAPLLDPAVGLVTCLYRGEQAESLSAVLEALHMGATYLPSVLVGRRYLRMRFALGATMALRREQLLQIGGFEPLLDCLADDYELGARVAATGRQVYLSSYVARSILGAGAFRDQWDREVRWAKCARVSRPLEYPALLLTFSTPLALLGAIVLHFSTVAWLLLGISLGVRWFVGWYVAGRIHDEIIRESLLWLPLRDLLTVVVWCAAGLGRQVTWRGRRYVLRDGGRLQQLYPRHAQHAAR